MKAIKSCEVQIGGVTYLAEDVVFSTERGIALAADDPNGSFEIVEISPVPVVLMCLKTNKQFAQDTTLIFTDQRVGGPWRITGQKDDKVKAEGLFFL